VVIISLMLPAKILQIVRLITCSTCTVEGNVMMGCTLGLKRDPRTRVLLAHPSIQIRNWRVLVEIHTIGWSRCPSGKALPIPRENLDVNPDFNPDVNLDVNPHVNPHVNSVKIYYDLNSARNRSALGSSPPGSRSACSKSRTIKTSRG
jgi:hypothetical protein